MFCVFWFDNERPHCHIEEDMGIALKFSEARRKEGMRFVTIASEVSGNVTKMGVDVTGPDYDWKKRRV